MREVVHLLPPMSLPHPSPAADATPLHLRLGTRVVVCLVAWLLTGCDLLGIEGAATVAARREAEGKAIGGACRHAARSIEQCYDLNKRADKAAVFAGWREMNDYMRENKMDPMPAAAAMQADAAPADEGPEATAEGAAGSGKAAGSRNKAHGKGRS